MDVYGYHKGVKFRVQIDKHRIDSEIIEMIHKMVELASKIKFPKQNKSQSK